MQFKERLDQAEARYNELTARMADPAVINDSEQYRKTAKAQSELAELVAEISRMEKGRPGIARCARHARRDRPRSAADGRTRVVRLEPEVAGIEQELQVLLLPKDPNDEKNVVLEIRKGAGGDEASLFAG